MLRSSQDQELVVFRLRVYALHLVNDDRRRIVLAEFQPPSYDRGQLILCECAVLAVNLRPQDALGTAGLVLQSEERKLVAFLGRADLQVANNSTRRNANATGQIQAVRSTAPPSLFAASPNTARAG